MISEYSQQSDELARLVGDCSADSLVWKRDETCWSILEIAGHLADAELLASVRIRRIITQDRPRLTGYDQETWAQALGYRNRKIEEVVPDFLSCDAPMSSCFGKLTIRAGDAAGHHDEYGEMTLREWVENYVAHTAKHLDQVRAVGGEYVKGKGVP